MKKLIPVLAVFAALLAVLSCTSGGSRAVGVMQLPQVDADIAVFPQLGHTSESSALFSPDGKQILSNGVGGIKLWDVITGREIRTFLGSRGSFSPDGKQVLSHDGDAIKLWDAFTGQEIEAFEHPGSFMGASFSPDGKQILSSGGGGLKLWDVIAGREIRTIVGVEGSFSPDGKKIFALSYVPHTVKVWDAESGREISTFSMGYGSQITSVCFSPDSQQILCCFYDGTVKLLNAATGREIRTFSGYRNGIFSPDGKQIISKVESDIILWDTDTGRVIKNFERGVTGSFSPDGKQILLGSDRFDKTVKLWDIATGREIRIFVGHTAYVTSVGFSPDGKQILSGSGDKTIKLWDIATGREIKTFAGHTGTIYAASFSPDGKQFIFSHSSYPSDYTFKLWDAVTGQEIKTFSVQKAGVGSLSFSPDGKYVLSGSLYEGTAKLWDISAGREIRTFVGHTFNVESVSFSPDGTKVLSGSSDRTVRLWDIATGREINTFVGHSASIRSISFSPDGKQVLSGSFDKTVKLWDVETGRELRTFSGHTESVESVSFSPDGKQILSGSSDRTIKLWDVETGRELRTFSGHTESVESVSFSPGGKQILSGSSDRTIKLWDVETGREPRTFVGHTAYVTSVGFSPDGKHILSGSSDGTIRLWDASTGKEIAQFISFSGSDSNLATRAVGLIMETEAAATSNEGEWLSITPDGYYQASPRGDRYLNVRVNNTVSGIDSYRSIFYNPDVVQARLQGKPDPASKADFTIQQAGAFLPPRVTIQSPANFSTTNTVTTNLSVAIVDQNQPIQNIKILVNGRLVGRNELVSIKGTSGLQAQKASLTVTGNHKTVNFELPITLDPGRNVIEVVAFNGYSESPRIPIEVTWNAPANQRPALPNLWILAVGVNNYSDPAINNLNYCVADAKGVIDSLKAQEGKRYAKVNSLLIADGEAVTPTAANIRRNLNYLDQAGERDVVLLFLAGHGISDNAGKFLFLPGDTRMNPDNTVNEASAISDNDIVQVLDRAGNLLVFIDACQSGGVDNDRLVRSLMDTNAFVFASSRGNELSQERPELGHGVFTYSVMDGLRGAIPARAQGNVTVLSLSGFVSQDVTRRTNGAQNPKAYSLGFYDFPLARIE